MQGAAAWLIVKSLSAIVTPPLRARPVGLASTTKLTVPGPALLVAEVMLIQALVLLMFQMQLLKTVRATCPSVWVGPQEKLAGLIENTHGEPAWLMVTCWPATLKTPTRAAPTGLAGRVMVTFTLPVPLLTDGLIQALVLTMFQPQPLLLVVTAIMPLVVKYPK